MAASHNTLREPAQPAVRGWHDVIDVAFPSFGDVTDATKTMTSEHSQRFRGSVRLATGRFYTSLEYETMRKEELAKPLP